MADSTLAVLPHPEFPQVFPGVIDRYIEQVDRVLLAYKRPVLDCCSFETPETSPGACNGLPCVAQATVFSLVDEQEYCLRHFREVSR